MTIVDYKADRGRRYLARRFPNSCVTDERSSMGVDRSTLQLGLRWPNYRDVDRSRREAMRAALMTMREHRDPKS